MGAAYTLAELIRTGHHLGHSDQLKSRLKLALTEANKSGVESVTQYVLGAAFEAVDRDEDKLKSILGELGGD